MDRITPQEAQRIVAAYLKVVEAHAVADVYPCSVGDLPQSKEVISAAFRSCVHTLAGTGQLTPELREYLEIAYVSMADYVTDDYVALLREYGKAGEALAAGSPIAKEKVTTDAWRQLSEQSRLAGQVARAITGDADRLRAEFRSWQEHGRTTDVFE
jgi:hypothetical protein